MAYEISHGDYRPGRVQWKGDLDNDGLDDFIIHFGSGKAGELVLFLSSKAEPGELFKKVARYVTKYCC